MMYTSPLSWKSFNEFLQFELIYATVKIIATTLNYLDYTFLIGQLLIMRINVYYECLLLLLWCGLGNRYLTKSFE